MTATGKLLAAAVAVALLAGCGASSGGGGQTPFSLENFPDPSSVTTQVANGRVQFSWPAVPGASTYRVTVASPTQTLWLWTGSARTVPYGQVEGTDSARASALATVQLPPELLTGQGPTNPPELAPALTADVTYTWYVTALGTNGAVLALSPLTTLKCDAACAKATTGR